MRLQHLRTRPQMPVDVRRKRVSKLARRANRRRLMLEPLETRVVLTAILPGFDLSESRPGTSADLSSFGLGTVDLQGVPLDATLGNSDTIVQRIDGINPLNPVAGTGTVDIELVALHLVSVTPVDLTSFGGPFVGVFADLHITIDKGDMFPNLPQPNALAPSIGQMKIDHTITSGGTFDSCFGETTDSGGHPACGTLGVVGGGVFGDAIFTTVGGDPNNPGDVLLAQPADRVVLSSAGSTWSHVPPPAYPLSVTYPAGQFYVTNLPHVGPHKVEPAAATATGGGDPIVRKTDILEVDVDSDGNTDPGDTLKYFVTITNNSATDQNGVTFSDNEDPNTTLTGAVQITPIAFDDAYNANLGSTLTVSASASGILANDVDPTVGGGAGVLDVIAQPVRDNAASTAPAGTLNVTLADGTFTYTPNGGASAGQQEVFTYNIVDAESLNALVTGVLTINLISVPPPDAVNDSYSSVGNVGINVPAGAGVLFNDTLNGGTITAFDATSANGGAVALNTADGSFTYNPAPGFEGMDTFTYTLTNGSGMDTATVTITVNDVIWFIDNGAAGTNAGTLQNPFQTTAAYNGSGLPQADDHIYLAETGTNYTTGLTLLNNQRLIGEGAVGTLDGLTGITLPMHSNSLPALGAANNPVITNTTGNNLTLASGNTIRGVDLTTSATRTGITGNTVGSLTINDVSVGGAGKAVDINTGALTVTFTSLSSNGATNGIVLNNTTGSFAVTGDGSTATQGGNNTGGIIQNTTSDGVVLNNVTGVTLQNMTIGDIAATPADSPDSTTNINGDGVSATNVTGLVLKNVKIARTEVHGVDGTNVTNFTMSDSLVLNAGDQQEENGLNFTGLFGANFVTNSLFDAFNETGIDILNINGTMDLTVSGTTFRDNQATVGNAGEEAILLDAQGTAQMNVLVTGSTFDDIARQAIDATPVGTSSVHLTVLNSFFVETNVGDAVIKFNPDGAAGTGRSNSITVRGNTFNDDTTGAYAVLLKNDSSGRMDAIIQGNTINDHAGVSLNHDDVGSGTANGESFVLIGGSVAGEENTITNPSGIGIDILVTESPATGSDPDAHVTILNNTVGQPPCPGGVCFLNGIRVQTFDFGRLNLHISGNTATGSDDFGGGPSTAGIAIDRFDSSIFRIQGLVGTTAANALAHINANNTSNTPATANGTFGTGTPTSPPATILPAPLMAAVDATAVVSSDPSNSDASAAPASSSSALDASSLSAIVAAAKARWMASGLSSAQQAALDEVTVLISDMPGWYLAQATGSQLTFDLDAAGHGWFIDSTPLDDSEFGNAVTATRLYTTPDQAPAGRIDLLTTVMHEMGHVLGLTDHYTAPERDSLMYGYGTTGERRLPAAGQASGAIPGASQHEEYLVGPLNIGTLPAGKAVSVIFQAQVNASPSASFISNQGNVGYTGGPVGGVPSDDPDTAAADDPTVTQLQVLPPTFDKVFAPDTIASTATSTLTFTIDNTAGFLAATSLDFTDNLPASIVVAVVPSASTTCTGGILTADAGTSVISYTGGSVAAGASCTVQVDVTSSTEGDHLNTTGDLTSSSGNSGTASDTLSVRVPPLFDKDFAPSSIVAGGLSSVTFSIDNSGNAFAATALDFTDNLPPGITVATPANASTTCTGGTLTAVNGSSTISYSGGSIGAGASCIVQVVVISGTVGDHLNTTGDLTSSSGNSGTASDTLSVQPPPLFAKVFSPDTIISGASSTLTFTIDNSASTLAASSLDFTDNLPASIIIATPANASTTCTGGTLTATAGSAVLSYTGGSVAAGASCTVQADVTSSTVGAHVNASGDLTSSSGNSGTATDTLNVIGLDFGDAFDLPGGPATGNPYPTLLEHNGARHALIGAFLGVSIDDEPDGQPTGDDVDGNDDEDGVVFTSPLIPGLTATVDVTTTGSGLLNAWIDFNDNGSWADPGEQIFTDFPLSAGLNAGLTFAVPFVAPTSETYARFRFDQGGGLSYFGPAPDGEVEDYDVAISNCATTVTNTNDMGAGSLRDAILCANVSPGFALIDFNIAGPGPHTITPLSALPAITEIVIIDGTTEPDFAGTPVIELNGTSAGAGVDGLTIAAGGTGSTIRGLAINRFDGSGIAIFGGSGNVIEGNFLGTDVTGTLDRGNTRHGVLVSQSSGNTIGGTTAAARNVISGNDLHGVLISGLNATGNMVQGNLIGTKISGTSDLGNSFDGVVINNAPNNTIGGTTVGATNTISGNDRYGVQILSTGAANNMVQGNFVGTDVNGTAKVGNGLSGVKINGASDNVIGGTVPETRNLISGNDGVGVLIAGTNPARNLVQGNFIGTDNSGAAALGNSLDGINLNSGSDNAIGGTAVGAGNEIAFNGRDGVRAAGAGVRAAIQVNSIFSNVGLGIDLGGDGVTLNDPNDTDAGPNQLQNFPLLTGAVLNGGNLQITYSVPSIAPNSAFPLTVEFFRADLAGQEGQIFLGSNTYLQGATPTATVPTGGAIPGTRIVATATDANGNTSEFSSDVIVKLVVNDTGDADDGDIANGITTLREAINFANANPIIPSISFDIAGAGPHTITPLSPLPAITRPVIIDGTTEPDFAGTPVVELNGDSAGAMADGLRITPTGAGSTIRGLAINRFSGSGIVLAGGSGNKIEGNFLGTAIGGGADSGNAVHGVFVSQSSGNTIGGTNAASRNVISGNDRNGVLISGINATGNLIVGNFIGTGANGTTDLGNSFDGVVINNGLNNTIGGTAPGARNVLSGNDRYGVLIIGTSATGNLVRGNFIGTDVTGTADVGNTVSGVKISSASGNTIGGTGPAARNVISGNDGVGVLIADTNPTMNLVQGNFIGTDNSGALALGNSLDGVNINSGTGNTIGGTSAGAGNKIAFNGRDGVRAAGTGSGNAIRSNSMFLNVGLGIDLNGNGVTLNDPDDSDAGPNNLQNFPVMSSAVLDGGNVQITYSVPSIAPNSAFPLTVEFFRADPAGQEGRIFLGSDSYTQGTTPTATVPNGGAAAGNKVVATATDANGNTSEFSANVTVANPLLAAGGARNDECGVGSAECGTLTEQQLAPIIDAAFTRFAAAGLAAQQLALLSRVQFSIADLPGATLGSAGGRTVTLDATAAGHGWFIDPTPLDDSEFTSGSRLSTLDSRLRMDLLTAVMHELGHAIGRDDLDPASHADDLMAATLAPGTRHTGFADDADAVFASGGWNN